MEDWREAWRDILPAWLILDILGRGLRWQQLTTVMEGHEALGTSFKEDGKRCGINHQSKEETNMSSHLTPVYLLD